MNNGTILENNNQSAIKKLMFWCEWEPPSLVTKQLHKLEGSTFPQYLHTELFNPELIQTTQNLNNCSNLKNEDGYRSFKKYYQNTDPCVFGDQFNYFVCLQAKQKRKGSGDMATTMLTELDKGSIILFGSKVSTNQKNKFIIDTVFVVKDWIDYYSLHDILKTKSPNVSKEYINIALQFLGENTFSYKRRLYFGATYSDPQDGIYSFVPCKIYNDNNQGFERPSLDLGDINYAHSQGYMCLEDTNNLTKIREFWLSIKCQVEKTCEIGLSFEMPRLQNKKNLEERFKTKI